MINYPIRKGDLFDTRSKLPYCVGLLLRLLKKNHCVYVICTTGFDRSPACVIAYLHWMTDTSLHAAYNYVTRLHKCLPDRLAIAMATWDLISRKYDGPATHSMTFVCNGHEVQDKIVFVSFTALDKHKNFFTVGSGLLKNETCLINASTRNILLKSNAKLMQYLFDFKNTFIFIVCYL